MAEYDERYGAWRDKSGGIHYNEGDANVANQSGGQGSTSEYNSVDLNSPEYNRKPTNYSSSVTDDDIARDAQRLADIVRRPITMALELEKKGYQCMRSRDHKGAADAFTTVYDILSAPNWDDYYNTYFGEYPHQDPQNWDSIYADRGTIFEEAGMACWRYASEQADKKNYDVAINYMTDAAVLSSGEMRESYLGGLGSYLYSRGELNDQKNLQEQAIADYRKAANCDKDWAEFAVKKLAEKGIQHTPAPVHVTERRTPDWVTNMIAKSIAVLNGDYGAGTSTAQTAAGIKFGRIVSGLVLGVICAFLGIIGIGGLIKLLTGADNIVNQKPLFQIAGLAVLFFYVWYKRKWLWIILIAAFSVFGGYILAGAPGLNMEKTETVAAATATVTANTLNLRAAPSTAGAVVEKLNKGDRLTLTGKETNGWAEVEHNGKKGYVDTKYITVE